MVCDQVNKNDSLAISFRFSSFEHERVGDAFVRAAVFMPLVEVQFFSNRALREPKFYSVYNVATKIIAFNSAETFRKPFLTRCPFYLQYR